jgi:hypothetical protein
VTGGSGNTYQVRGFAGLFSDIAGAAASDHNSSAAAVYYLMLFGGMSLYKPGIVEHHPIGWWWG